MLILSMNANSIKSFAHYTIPAIHHFYRNVNLFFRFIHYSVFCLLSLHLLFLQRVASVCVPKLESIFELTVLWESWIHAFLATHLWCIARVRVWHMRVYMQRMTEKMTSSTCDNFHLRENDEGKVGFIHFRKYCFFWKLFIF